MSNTDDIQKYNTISSFLDDLNIWVALVVTLFTGIVITLFRPSEDGYNILISINIILSWLFAFLWITLAVLAMIENSWLTMTMTMTMGTGAEAAQTHTLEPPLPKTTGLDPLVSTAMILFSLAGLLSAILFFVDVADILHYAEDKSRSDNNNTGNWYKNVPKINLVLIGLIVVLCMVNFVLRCLTALRRMTMGGAEAAQTHIHEPELQAPKTGGLDLFVTAALPTFTYKTECHICLTGLVEGEAVKLLPKCKHVFHVGCIDRWLQANTTCPTCRSGAESRAESESLDDAVGQSSKAEGSGSGSGSSLRLSSFRRILSWERSDRRLQEDVVEDLERQ